VQQLGFSTDNGAFYYYVTEEGKNYEDTLIDVKRYAEAVHIPYHYVLLDSWWCASRAVQFHPHGGQLDFVRLPARTMHPHVGPQYVW